MEMLMLVLMLLVMGGINVFCFTVGAKVGQKVVKGEPVETPTLNPLEVYRAHEAKKEQQMEQDRINTILRNIESYDGTASGQEDVPGR